MHGALARKGAISTGESHFRATFPALEALEIEAPVEAPIEYSRFGDARRPNWAAIGAVAFAHVILLFILVHFDVVELSKPKAAPLVVDLIPQPPAPPPPSADPVPEIAVRQVRPLVVAPPPIVQTPAPPPQVMTTRAPPPPQAVVVAPPSPRPSVSAPVSVDLSSKMVAGKPPRYPTESRRKHETGTVLLRLVLGLDGSVSDIAIAQSSGFDRLDKAALEAVRRWRWSPTLQAGQAVQVRGVVEIPFVLQG